MLNNDEIAYISTLPKIHYSIESNMRIEITNKHNVPDGRSENFSKIANSFFSNEKELQVIVNDVILIDADLSELQVKSIFVDSVSQDFYINTSACDSIKKSISSIIEVSYKAGVTDTLALTVREALENELGKKNIENKIIQTARQYILYGTDLINDDIQKFALSLYNPLIQDAVIIHASDWDNGMRLPPLYASVRTENTNLGSDSFVEGVEVFNLEKMNDAELLEFSKKKLLALSLDEMKAIQAYYADEKVKTLRTQNKLPTEALDTELEMIAQTWSEHCKHKIFNATVDYCENGKRREIKSLFKTYIKASTDKLMKDRPWLKSVFKDNSGIVEFNDTTLLCIKAETHNSPSALDPYGGAITGIVGVNRDILGSGIGAKPLFNTDVLCFGYPDTKQAKIPKGLLHPLAVLKGVHKGIIDGGNQSGIPTVAGAFLFDDSFLGKPLVFCGSGGIMPKIINGKNAWEKEIKKGHAVVMLGGRIGKDGIHGATFSSLVLSEASPTSAVQIGDPIIQRKMTDFLIEARDLGLYSGITDNGAGGLSSSLGEMATECGGIEIDLSACPLKYSGLLPWEILVSESQERMSLSVPKESLQEFMLLAEKRGVEASNIGVFTDSGSVLLKYKQKTVGLLSLDFLHSGLPTLFINAVWNTQNRVDEKSKIKESNYEKMLLALLSEPNIASKEKLVRQYDHEVKAHTMQRPFVGEKMDGPSDGAVLKPLYDSYEGLTITHGIAPRVSESDAYDMAQSAFDEAFRSHIALGGTLERVCALDNFCWPDPVESIENPDGAFKMGQLVRSLEGLKDICESYGVPLISGKDSMKNDAFLDGKKVSVKPTLLITLMGMIQDVRKTCSSDFKRVGDLVYLLGTSTNELGCSLYERLVGLKLGNAPKVNREEALTLYAKVKSGISGRIIKSCHDLSDGGLSVALAESCIGAKMGASVNIENISRGEKLEVNALLFAETPSRFIVSVHPLDRERFENTMRGSSFTLIGEVTKEYSFEMNHGKERLISLTGETIETAFKKDFTL